MAHGDAQLIAALGTGNKFDAQVADAISDGDLDSSAVATVRSTFKVALLTGEDDDPATYVVAGASVTSTLVFVGHITTAASIATIADATSDFEFTDDDELTSVGPTDYSNDQLLVIYFE